MSPKFSVEKYTPELGEEIREVGLTWWKGEELDIAFSVYDSLQQQGLLSIFTIRDEEKLVGYAVFIISVSPFTGRSQAYCETWGVKEEYRNAWMVLKFLKYICKKLDFVKEILMGSNPDHDLEPLYKRAGFKKSMILHGCIRD